jgi:hypothetical protein
VAPIAAREAAAQDGAATAALGAELVDVDPILLVARTTDLIVSPASAGAGSYVVDD